MIERRRVGQVTKEERDEIRRLVERHNGLVELGMIVDEAHRLHDRLTADRRRTAEAKSHWWATMAERYQWESADSAQWTVDFETREVWLQPTSSADGHRGAGTRSAHATPT